MASNSQVSQHKRLAMGQSVGSAPKFARGGSTGGNLKTGIKDSPLTVAKMNNGIPGMKKGGGAKGC